MNGFKIGDKVAYSVQFLKSVGMSHGDMAHARGVVQSIDPKPDYTLVYIKWDRDMPEKVNAKNLAHVGPNAKFCAV